MKLSTLRRRAAIAVAAIAAAAVPLAVASPAGADADTSTYTSASFLESALSLPDKPEHVIESVTYDRFQWLLQQEGKFAFLVGDPATDPSFRSRAQQVEDAAETAGVKRVYWFNPNLSGNARVGSVTEPNLDTRDPDGITSLSARSQRTVGLTWLDLIAKYLGNGVTTAPITTTPNTGPAQITATTGTSQVNDYGRNAGFSTEVGNPNGGALYDYTSGKPSDLEDSFFFFYDKDNTVTPTGGGTAQPAKVVAWVNLTDAASASAARADVATAIATCGAANVAEIAEFEWWKSSNNRINALASPWAGGGVPNLTDDAKDPANGGWRVHQVTYPELIHILETESAKETVLLFGGTWCPNTRPVLPSINDFARRNGTTVINFDTILDGGVVGNGNAARNALQSRGPHTFTPSGGATENNAVPSFLYGDLVTQHLANLKTEYKANASNAITYWPGGDSSAPTNLKSQPRLQVPYLFGYKGKPGSDPDDGVVRQWIIDKGNGDFTEYMTVWPYANPQPDQLNISPTQLPRELTTVWSRINSQVASFTWQTDPTSNYANTATDADAGEWLRGNEFATVAYTAGANIDADQAAVAVSSAGAPGAIDVSPAALSAALTALGTSAPANNAAARRAYFEAKRTSPQDPQLIARLETVVGGWGVSQQRKTTVNTRWGSRTNPNSIAGGVAAVRAAEVFFSELPRKPGTGGGGGSTPPRAQAGGTVQAPAPPPSAVPGPGTQGRAPSATRARTRLTARISGTVVRRPTTRRRGTYLVRVTGPRGASVPTGQVTLNLTRGRRTLTVTGALSKGRLTLRLPRLARGTWKVAISWPGNARYRPATARGGAVKVRR